MEISNPSLKRSYIFSKKSFLEKAEKQKFHSLRDERWSSHLFFSKNRSINLIFFNFSPLEFTSLQFFHKNHQNHQSILHQNLHCKNNKSQYFSKNSLG